MNCYEQIDSLIKESGFSLTPLSAVNDEGENVIIEKGRDEHDEYYETTTVQHNDWCRINRYYKDGTNTETFER